MGRRPHTEDQVRAQVLAYCERHGVSPGPEGLPPFPTGKRETRQHREWLTVYRALQRSKARVASPVPVEPDELSTRACPVCSGDLEPDLAVPYPRRAARSARPALLHPACAELARLAETLGPAAVEGLRRFLWPGRAGASPSPRPQRS